MTADDLLRTPGEILVAARKKTGLSLDELAERTKIAPPMLEAIERDEYHRLSDPLYVKSFLRAYAVEVGLDPNEVLDLHTRSTGGGSPAPGPDGVWVEKTVTINRVGLPWGRIVPLAAGVVLGVVVIALLIRGCGGDSPDSGAAVDQPLDPAAGAVAQRESLLAPTAESVADAGELPASDQDSAPGDPGAEEPAAMRVEADPQPVATTPAPLPARQLPTALAGDPDLNMAGPYRGDLVLRVLATGPARVRVRRDGEHVYRTVDLAGDGTDEDPLPAQGVVPGRAYAVREGSVVYWRARDHFSLKLDPIDGVSVAVNGRERDLSRLRPGQEMILDAHAAD
ncbi:MAG: hypothetical protein GY838_06280 [bacterium]|nr:hypothetical protein [bacterium]